MILLLWFWLMFAPHYADATEYFSSTTGNGSTCSEGAPCTMAGGIAKMVAGDTLNVNDGTYTGTNGMMVINTKSCTVGARCTIQAVNDGAVLINGQSARVPLDVVDSSYWTIQGFNFANSNSDVCKIRGNDSTPFPWTGRFIEFKRNLCWNASPTGNRMDIAVHDISDVLIEDSGGFGISRTTIAPFNTNRVTFRRCWARWNQYDNDNQPHAAGQLVYNSYDNLWENCIFELDDLNASQSSTGDKFGNASTTGQILDTLSSNKDAKDRKSVV